MTNVGVAPDWWMAGEKDSDWFVRYHAGCSSGNNRVVFRDIEDPYV